MKNKKGGYIRLQFICLPCSLACIRIKAILGAENKHILSRVMGVSLGFTYYIVYKNIISYHIIKLQYIWLTIGDE